MPSFRLKRGDSTKVGSYVGNEGELIYNTETKKIHVMDGSTSGGAVVEGGGDPSIVETPAEVVKVDSKWASEPYLYEDWGSYTASSSPQINSSYLNMLKAPPRHDWTVAANHSDQITNHGSQFSYHFNNLHNTLVIKTDHHKFMGIKLDLKVEDPMFFSSTMNGYDFTANSTKIADYFANPGNYSEIVTYDASVNGFNGPLNDWGSGQNIRSVNDILFIVQGGHQETNVRDGRIVKFNINDGSYIGQITTNQSEQYEFFTQFAVNSTHIAIRKSKTDTVEIHTHGGTGPSTYVKTITEQTGLSGSSRDYYGFQPNMNENYLTIGSPGYVNTPTAPNPNSRGAVEVYDTANFNLIGRLLPDPTKNHWIQGAVYGYNLSSTNIQAVTYAVNGSQPVEKIIYLYNLNGMTGDKTPTATISSTENGFGRFLEFAVVEDSTGTPRTLLIVPVGEDNDAMGQKIYIYDASNNGELLSVIDSQSSPDLFPDTIFDTSNPFKSQIIALHAKPEGQNYAYADTNGIATDFLMIMGTRWHHGMAKASLYMENETKRKVLVNGVMSNFESSDTALKSEKNNLLVKLLEIENRLSAGGL
jgi:hypothetical protein